MNAYSQKVITYKHMFKVQIRNMIVSINQ